MNLTIKIIDEKLNKILLETEKLFNETYQSINSNKDLLIRTLEFERNIDLFLSNIPEQFENKSVYMGF